MRQPHPPVSLARGPRHDQGRANTLARPDERLRLRTDPVRLLCSASPWRAAGFLLSYLVIGPVLFWVVLAVSFTTAMLAVTIALIPLLIAAAAVIRGCAEVQRVLLRQVFSGPVRGSYPPPAGQGLWRQACIRWTSGATWRDLACLVGLFGPLYVLDAAVLMVWTSLLTGIAMPLWYRVAADVCIGSCGPQHTPGVMIGSFPHGPDGAGHHGFYVHTTGSALVVAAVCAVAFLLFNYVLVGAARMHASVARAVLRRPADPLGPVLDVLAEPGPLGPLLGSQTWPGAG